MAEARSAVGGLEPLSPEGSCMGEVNHIGGYHSNNSNQVTENKSVMGFPRKLAEDQRLLLEGGGAPTGEVLDLPSTSSSDGEDRTAKQVLRDAGVDFDLDDLVPAEGGGAPLELLSQCVSCMMQEEFEAARILCDKVLQFEPENATVLQLQPLLNERLKQLDELSTESSSSSSSESHDTTPDSSEEDGSNSEVDDGSAATSTHH